MICPGVNTNSNTNSNNRNSSAEAVEEILFKRCELPRSAPQNGGPLSNFHTLWRDCVNFHHSLCNKKKTQALGAPYPGKMTKIDPKMRVRPVSRAVGCQDPRW
eukprot:2118530-Rhodomonas_salina.1